MVRVMYAPLNFGDIVQDGVYDAFEQAGCELKVFDYMTKYVHTKNNRKIRTDFVTEVKNFQPDMLFLQIQHTSVIDANTISDAKRACPKVKVVNWTGDVRNNVPHTYRKIGTVSDYNLISSTGQLNMFRQAMQNVDYLQIGYNPKLYLPPETQRVTFKNDALFIGHYNTRKSYPGTEDRLRACKLLRARFDERFALYGFGWPKEIKTLGSINQRHVASEYQNSVCSISVSHYNEIDHYFSDRLLMCLASGRPCVVLAFPKWESYFTNMSDLVIVDSVNEIPDAVDMLKSNPELANFIGEQGAAKVLAEHTYYSRIKELLNMVGLNGE